MLLAILILSLLVLRFGLEVMSLLNRMREAERAIDWIGRRTVLRHDIINSRHLGSSKEEG